MAEQKQQEQKKEEQKNTKRQIIIETDGNSIDVTKAEVAGNLELFAILTAVLERIKK